MFFKTLNIPPPILGQNILLSSLFSDAFNLCDTGRPGYALVQNRLKKNSYDLEDTNYNTYRCVYPLGVQVCDLKRSSEMVVSAHVCRPLKSN